VGERVTGKSRWGKVGRSPYRCFANLYWRDCSTTLGVTQGSSVVHGVGIGVGVFLVTIGAAPPPLAFTVFYEGVVAITPVAVGAAVVGTTLAPDLCHLSPPVGQRLLYHIPPLSFRLLHFFYGNQGALEVGDVGLDGLEVGFFHFAKVHGPGVSSPKS